MPHIQLREDQPGIRSLFYFSPQTAKPLSELAQVLLHDANSLSPGERELIATYVCSENDCYYCQSAHGAIAAHHLGGNDQLVADIKRDFESAAISDKLKALLVIAGQVQRGGKHVQKADIERARELGASDQEIHDTVLIAAAFCMYNRYVDGLATWAPQDPAAYRERAAAVATGGYLAILSRLGDSQPAAAGNSTKMSNDQKMKPMFLPDVEGNPQPSPHTDVIRMMQGTGAEYPKILHLFAFRPQMTEHLSRFTQEIMRGEGSISHGLRELIAAFTSNRNQCPF